MISFPKYEKLYFISKVIDSRYSDIDYNVELSHLNKSLKIIEMIVPGFNSAIKVFNFIPYSTSHHKHLSPQ